MTDSLSSIRSKPRLLDLFCGAGGCTKGYQRAGFYVVGVDREPQPNYCGEEFIQADALDFLGDLDVWRVNGWGFDAIHASPPCPSLAALDLIRDPARHTTRASAVDAAGNPCAGATERAVAWSIYGAVNRVAVLDLNTLPHVETWRRTIFALREMAATHQTSHADSLRLLEALR